MILEVLFEVATVFLYVFDWLNVVQRWSFKRAVFLVEAIQALVIVCASDASTFESIISQQHFLTFVFWVLSKWWPDENKNLNLCANIFNKNQSRPVRHEKLLSCLNWSVDSVNECIVVADCVNVWITGMIEERSEEQNRFSENVAFTFLVLFDVHRVQSNRITVVDIHDPVVKLRKELNVPWRFGNVQSL